MFTSCAVSCFLWRNSSIRFNVKSDWENRRIRSFTSSDSCNKIWDRQQITKVR